MRRSIILALGILALAGQANAETSRISVPATEAELASPEGVASAYGRIEAAAQQACRAVYSDPFSFYYLKSACQSETLSEAIAATHNTALQDYHAARTAPGASVEIAAR